jgi:hypothetical protein
MPNVGGVQSWSVGPLYPYHVVIRGGATRGVCFIQGPSGEGSEHAFDGSKEFRVAHQAAERDGEYMLAADELVALAATAPVPVYISLDTAVLPSTLDLQAISDGDLLEDLTAVYSLDDVEEVVTLTPEDFISGTEFAELIR